MNQQGSTTLRVVNDRSYSCANVLVRNGVPIPAERNVTDTSRCQLYKQGTVYPAQFVPLAWWPDGQRIKWLLVSFRTNIPAGAAEEYELVFQDETAAGTSAGAKPLAAPALWPAHIIETGALTLQVGTPTAPFLAELGLHVDGQWQKLIDAAAMEITARDGSLLYPALPDTVTSEENGPESTLVRLAGQYRYRDGVPSVLRYTARLQAWRDSSTVVLQHTLVNDSGDTVALDDVSLVLPVGCCARGEVRRPDGKLAASGETAAASEPGFGVLQEDSERLQLGELSLDRGDDHTTDQGRFDGWLTVRTGQGWAVSAAMEHFWQRYPKALSLRGDTLRVGLLPGVSGQRDSFRPAEQLKQYYELAPGESRSHTIVLRFHPEQEPVDIMTGVVEHLHRPLLAMAEPAWYTESSVLGDLVPFDAVEHPVFESRLQESLELLLARREDKELYGDRNFGDDYYGLGRWNNGEYDYPHVGMLMFLRGAGRDWFDLFARPAAQHMIDIDTHTGGPYSGAVLQHDAKDPVFGHRSEVTGALGSHAWLQGILEYACFSGDFYAREIALQVADRWARQVLDLMGQVRQGDVAVEEAYKTARTWGWSQVSLTAAYQTVPHDLFLQAIQEHMDHIWELRRPDGMLTASFDDPAKPRLGRLLATPILDAIVLYYQSTGDARARQLIRDIGTTIARDWWDEQAGRFIYHREVGANRYQTKTDCSLAAAAAYAYVYTPEEEREEWMWERVLAGYNQSLASKIPHSGKDLCQTYRFVPRLLALIARKQKRGCG